MFGRLFIAIFANKNIVIMQTTIFNPTQKHLLKMFSYATTEKELDIIKDALAAYFAANVDKAMDELWDKGDWNDDKNETILTEDLHKIQK